MSNMRFPRWAGPFVGLAAGFVLGARVADQEGQGLSPDRVVPLGALIGLGAGLVITLLDSPSRGRGSSTGTLDDPDGSHRTVRGESLLVGRFPAVLSIGLGWIPVIGAGPGLAALLMNRRVRGWPRAVSRFGAVLSLFVTTAFLLFMLLFPLLLPSG